MATGFVHLFPGGFGPDGTTNSASASLEYLVSSTAASGGKPKLTRMRLAFDPTTPEYWQFEFKVPGDYSSGGTFRGTMSSAATSGNVVWLGGIGEASGDITNDTYNAADASSATAVSGTANAPVEFTISLTNTGIAANDSAALFIGRDATNGSDTVNSNDVYLYDLTYEYTTT